METIQAFDIQEIPLRSPRHRRQVELFLAENGLRLENVDLYLAVLDTDGRICAGAGLSKDIIQCVAVSEHYRGSGVSNALISRLLSLAAEQGRMLLRVFTKTENIPIFQSLGFHLVAEAPLAALLENGPGLESWLARIRKSLPATPCSSCGCIVLNANPLTLGHLHLIRTAASRVERLYLLPLMEEGSAFSYAERYRMLAAAVEALSLEQVYLLEGGPYVISAATFPSYFLKELSDIAVTQMRLDLSLFAGRIAPALGIQQRFVGSEIQDPLTARYNRLMQEILPDKGVQVCEIPRLCQDMQPISASSVRKALQQGSFRSAAALVPQQSYPYLVSYLIEEALRRELDLPAKPGLVGPDGPGAHQDMDYGLMSRAIAAIRRSVSATWDDPLLEQGRRIEAEALAESGGVNTHRGAIFALTLAARAFLRLPSPASATAEELAQQIREGASLVPPQADSNGSRAARLYPIKGALRMAQEGYKPLFADWLPFYRGLVGLPEQERLQRTLLRILSSLDDTCLIHRSGYERAQACRAEAASVLATYPDGYTAFVDAWTAEGLSPGGAADMLSLTLLIDSLLR